MNEKYSESGGVIACSNETNQILSAFAGLEVKTIHFDRCEKFSLI